MADNVVELVVKLNDQLTGPLQGLRSQLNQFSMSMGTVLAGAAAAAATAVGALVVQGFRSADALGDAAERIGVSVESLSRLKFVAEQSDTSFEALTFSLKRFAVIQSSAASGGKDAADALAVISLKAADLKGLQLEDQLAKIADQFARIKDPADKTRAAIELFGRSGEQLVPMLNRGGAGIRDLTAEADRLGITLDGKTVRAIDATDKALTKLKATIAAFGSHLAGSIALAIMGPQDEIDAATIRLQKLTKERDDFLARRNMPGEPNYGRFDDAYLKRLNAQIAGAQEGLEVLKRAAQYEQTKNPLAVPIDDKENQRLLDSLQAITISESLLKDPIIEWEKQTRTSLEKTSIAFDEFEATLETLVKAGKITEEEAAKRGAEHLDDVLKTVQVSVQRLKVPLSAQQQQIKDVVDTVKEGLTNLAQSGQTSGRAILKYLLAAFESKALFAAIEAIGNALTRVLSGSGSSKKSALGAFIGGLFGHAAGGGGMSGPRIVGEDGPELDIGGGQIMNRRQLQFAMAGTGNINYSPSTTINVQGGGDPQQTAQYVEVRIQQNNKKQLEQISRIWKQNGYGAMR